jgi:2-polyprenyl-6-methoxyphenol hydroxylase-like FAD-dependent oxidoreductase
MGYGHAVVAGGSIAGLAAAQALADTFDTVTLIERDDYPPTGQGFRRGVPQARHTHVLLEGGQRALEQLFPGLTRDLSGAGAHRIGVPQDLRWLNTCGWFTRVPSKRHMFSLSRELMDHLVRQRLTATANVTIAAGCTVTGLLPDATGVGGVRLTRADGSVADVAADLVVDATGRNTRTPHWLAELGYRPPKETRINASLAYASRRYRIPDGFDGDWKAVYLQAKPPNQRRGAVLFPIEDNRWIVTLGGIDGVGGVGTGPDRPPTDEAGFLDFAASLRSPLIYEAIRHAEPLTDITAYRRTENRRRHYDKLRRWPDRLIVVGDAACAFNPIYGQGMTVAAQTALTLQHALRESSPHQPGFTRKTQRAIARCGDPAWLIATGEDLRYPHTTGATAGPATRLTHRWLDRVTAAANTDPIVTAAFFDVLLLLAPPTSLFRPAIAWRALRPRQPQRTTLNGAPDVSDAHENSAFPAQPEHYNKPLTSTKEKP